MQVVPFGELPCRSSYVSCHSQVLPFSCRRTTTVYGLQIWLQPRVAKLIDGSRHLLECSRSYVCRLLCVYKMLPTSIVARRPLEFTQGEGYGYKSTPVVATSHTKILFSSALSLSNCINAWSRRVDSKPSMRRRTTVSPFSLPRSVLDLLVSSQHLLWRRAGYPYASLTSSLNLALARKVPLYRYVPLTFPKRSG